jgi:thiamine biosynthesis lipoprotein
VSAETAAAQQRLAIAMDTTVSLRTSAAVPATAFDAMAERAYAWFHSVEQVCSRFDPMSEVMQLVSQVGSPVTISPLLFQALQFALAVAEMSEGAFDPTVGATLEARGFNRHYLTGEIVATDLVDIGSPSYRDVQLDERLRTVTLCRPLILDLGAVVKGLAIDLAARELAPLQNFSIDAGGDLYVAGRNEVGERWRVGIRHPRAPEAVAAVLRLTDAAVCTSGDYERPAPSGGHHIIDPHSGRSPDDLASVTVVAPNAMLADALSTAAFVLGPSRGLRLLESQGLDGLFLSASLERSMTPGMAAYLV